jgi:hypothetical protein
MMRRIRCILGLHDSYVERLLPGVKIVQRCHRHGCKWTKTTYSKVAY